MTNLCNCKAEHWQPHVESCPAYKPRPLLTVENIRSGAVPSDAVAVGFLLGEIELLRDQRDTNLAKEVETVAQLRGNLSLAEEGLANYALGVDGLRATLTTAHRWLTNHGRHDESQGPCYGRKYPYPSPDTSQFECRCGLHDLIKQLDSGSHEPGEGLLAAEITNECTHWFSAERGGTFCCYCGVSAGDINGNGPSSVRQKLYADVYVTWMKEWAGQVSMADLAAEKAQEALAAFDEATGEKPQGASRDASSKPCECLILDKEPSAYHWSNCPRYVAGKL